jgi:flagellar motor switch protein FliG
MPPQNTEETYKQMKSEQKAALLFIALGQRWASAIMRQLKPEEVKKIAFWINKMNYVPQEITERVIREFYEGLAKKTSLASTGGKDYLMDVLGGMMGQAKAQDLIDELHETEESQVFRILTKVDPRQLGAYLRQEQPQTIALMLSYLEAGRAGAILQHLTPETQVEVIYRLATMEDSDPDIIAAMERSLHQNLGEMATGRNKREVGGPKTVAEILNNLPQAMEKAAMEALSERDFDLASKVKELMFVFADIVMLDDKSIQTLIKEIDSADLTLSLKGANDSVKDKVFKNISKRQAETIAEELSFMGPVKASTVQEAQQKIINVIKKLDEEGKILIQGKGGGDGIIA